MPAFAGMTRIITLFTLRRPLLIAFSIEMG